MRKERAQLRTSNTHFLQQRQFLASSQKLCLFVLHTYQCEVVPLTHSTLPLLCGPQAVHISFRLRRHALPLSYPSMDCFPPWIPDCTMGMIAAYLMFVIKPVTAFFSSLLYKRKWHFIWNAVLSVNKRGVLKELRSMLSGKCFQAYLPSHIQLCWNNQMLYPLCLGRGWLTAANYCSVCCPQQLLVWITPAGTEGHRLQRGALPATSFSGFPLGGSNWDKDFVY